MKIRYLNLFLIFLFLISFIFADSNGVWHYVEDLKGNIFGGDEQSNISNFTFINNVYFQKKVIFNSKVGIGVSNPTSALEVQGKVSMLNSTTDEDDGSVAVTKDYLLLKLDELYYSLANWKVGDWSDCTKTCGGGTQIRDVFCKVGDENVDKKYCTDVKPALSQDCNTQDCFECGTNLIQYEGGIWNSDGTLKNNGGYYKTVQMGTQCWLKENINAGDMVNIYTGFGAAGIQKYCYGNNEANCGNGYGGTYSYSEIMIGGSPQGICPEGWHIPSNNDWHILAEFTKSPSASCPTFDTKLTSTCLGTHTRLEQSDFALKSSAWLDDRGYGWYWRDQETLYFTSDYYKISFADLNIGTNLIGVYPGNEYWSTGQVRCVKD